LPGTGNTGTVLYKRIPVNCVPVVRKEHCLYRGTYRITGTKLQYGTGMILSVPVRYVPVPSYCTALQSTTGRNCNYRATHSVHGHSQGVSQSHGSSHVTSRCSSARSVQTEKRSNHSLVILRYLPHKLHVFHSSFSSPSSSSAPPAPRGAGTSTKRPHGIVVHF
jgi:hypothetical protein